MRKRKQFSRLFLLSNLKKSRRNIVYNEKADNGTELKFLKFFGQSK